MADIEYAKSTFLQGWRELPDSVRTLYRAQLLVLLARHQPTTSYHFTEFGYHRENVRKYLRYFVNDELISEKYHLYRLTEQGDYVVGRILSDPLIVEWVNQFDAKRRIYLNIGRPHVEKIDD